MTAITVRFPDECVKLDNVEERRVLTDLEVIYEGGLLHGETAGLGLIANFVIDLCAPTCLECKVVRRISLKGEVK
jgi:hypothetical protein